MSLFLAIVFINETPFSNSVYLRLKVKLSRYKYEDLDGEYNVWLPAELSALPAGRTLPPRKLLGPHFC